MLFSTSSMLGIPTLGSFAVLCVAASRQLHPYGWLEIDLVVIPDIPELQAPKVKLILLAKPTKQVDGLLKLISFSLF